MHGNRVGPCMAPEEIPTSGVFRDMGCESMKRELAQRLSGSDEIRLVWLSQCKRVEVSIRDVSTGVGFQLEVPPGRALDAFHHPYVYAASLGRHDG